MCKVIGNCTASVNVQRIGVNTMEILKFNELLSTKEKRIRIGESIVDIIARDCDEEIIKKNCQVGSDSDGSVKVSITNRGVPSFRKFKSFETSIRADGSIVSEFRGTGYGNNFMEFTSNSESGLSSIYIDASGKYVCNYILEMLKTIKSELNDPNHIKITDDGVIDDIRYILKDYSFNKELKDRLLRKGCVSAHVDGTSIWLINYDTKLSLSFNKKSPSVTIRANTVDDVKVAVTLIDYICEFCHTSAAWVCEHEKITNRYRDYMFGCNMITEQLAKSVFKNQAVSQKIIMNNNEDDYYNGAMFHSVQFLQKDDIIDITTILSGQSIDMNVVDSSTFNQLKVSGTMSKARIVTTNGYNLINRQLQTLDNLMEVPNEHSHPLPLLPNINRMLKNKYKRQEISEYAKALFDAQVVEVTENDFHLAIFNTGERRIPYKESLLIKQLSETEVLLEWNIHGRIKNMNLWRLFDKINHGM